MNETPTILAVDDTTESLALLATILTPAGYQVRPADSGELALAAVAANPPDLILLDVRMEGVNGLEVCRRLKAREETRHIPIILITAFADASEWVEGLRLGAADYITKPFQAEELLTRVKAHLTLSRARISLEQQTAALRHTNQQLRSEIVTRERVEGELRQSLDQAERSRRAMLSTVEDQKRAEEEAAIRSRQQAAVAELGQLALTGAEMPVLMDRAVRRVAQVLDVELCKVLELLPDRSAMLLRAGVGWQEGLVGRATADIGPESQAGFTLESQGLVIVEDLRTERRFHGLALLHDHHVVSGLSTIIGDPERPYGVLGAYTTRRRSFTEHDLHFLQGVAHLLASAVQRQQVETALRDSEHRLAITIDAARLGTFEWDLVTGRVVRNARDAELFGLALEEFDGTYDGFAQRVDPADLASVNQALERSKRDRSVYHHEFRVVWRDGSVHWLAHTGRFSYDDRTGQPDRMHGVVADVTARKETDARMTDQMAELRLLYAALSAAANAVMITDRTGTIAWVNPAFTDLTGYSTGEAVGKNPRDLVKSGAHGPEFYRDLWKALLAGRVWRGEITNRRKDGRLYPEEQMIAPVKDASGEITHFVAFKRDITDEKRLQAQFLQAQKMESVGLLAGGVAHDFNNLITAINVTADLASVRLREDDPLREDFDRIREAGERAALLTQQLLAFSRNQIMRREALSLGEIVTKMQDMLQRLLGEDIELMVVSAEGLGCVLADRGQIEQVVMNMAVNARDAMPTGGALMIETEAVELDEAFAGTHESVRPGPHVMLAVSDTGIGLDEATQARIFEPFFTTKEPGKGTGLGLATVYGIVKQSDGSIWVYSEPGKGTTFKIYLPRFDGVQPAQRPRPTPTAMRGTETILIVEDEEMLRTLARRLLELVGYTVLTAGSGEEALLMLERHEGPVHLVLTDVVMPGISGRELAARLATSHAGVKVLYTSGYTDDVILRHGLLDRTTHFIGKPFSMKDLTRKVREVLDS